jgi:hypothetical protein
MPARDSDEDGVLAPLDTETGILDDKVRFRVLLIDLIAVAQGYTKGRKNRPMDCVKKVFDLLLIAAFVGINSKKWHCVLLMPKSWQLVWKIGKASSLAAVLSRFQFELVVAATAEGCEWTCSVTLA